MTPLTERLEKLGAHTPGPWEAEGDTIHAALDNRANIVIALVNPYQELRTRPEYANARLIASAPELYGDLAVIIQAFAPKDHPLTKRALDTLAKARGES